MLINSVILFLRDALPIFLLIGIVLSFGVDFIRTVIPSVLIGMLISVAVYFNMSWLNELADGAGFELFKSGLLVINYLLCSSIFVLYQHLKTGHKSLIFGLAVICIIIINGSSFLVYFAGYWSTGMSNLALPLGTILGLGINMSIAVLAFLGLSMLKNHRAKLVVLLVFTVGQTSEITSLLQQIDWLASHSRLWDSSWLVSDSSEYGHLLHAMFGYEATPSGSHLVVQAVCLIVPILLSLMRHQKRAPAALEVNS